MQVVTTAMPLLSNHCASSKQQALILQHRRTKILPTHQLDACSNTTQSQTAMCLSQVYKGILNASLSVAIKSINDDSNKAKIAFIEEIVCLMNLRHANVRPALSSQMPLLLCTPTQSLLGPEMLARPGGSSRADARPCAV